MLSNKKNNSQNLTKASTPPPFMNNSIRAIALIAILLSCLAFVINFLGFHFTGNNYYPKGSLLVGLSLVLIMLGCRLLFSNHHCCYLISRALLYFFLVMAIIALMTTAAQYTPFQPIDQKIVDFEARWGIHITALVNWTEGYPRFKQLLIFIYDSLDYQMAFLPIFMIVCLRFSAVRDYLFLLLFSAVIGFSFYYFFPTTAPASIVHSDFFTDAQRATGIKFMEIHHHLKPSTIEGGMIALPSFHALWAWFCLYLCRGIPLLFAILLPINLLLIASCVLLGWHYPSDLLGSLILALLTHRALYLALHGNKVQAAYAMR